MGFIVNFFEAGRANVRVNLRRHEAFMAEQFLNAANIGPAVE
jgi:hypothetical protein